MNLSSKACSVRHARHVRWIGAPLIVAMVACPIFATGASADAVPARAAAVMVTGKLPPAPAGVADLKFGEFFRTPVGPRGLEPTARLRALQGRTVRVVGFMVHREQPVPGRFILTAMPLRMSEDEDGLADDLPPQALFVQLQQAGDAPPAFVPGLLALTGTLELGPRDEPDGRVSNVRLLLDAPSSAALAAGPATTESVR